MLSLPSGAQVFLCAQPVDLRKSFDGLRAAVEAVFARSVLDGHLFLFLNQRRDRLKALWWDRDGLVIFYKRLEAGRFELPPDEHADGRITLDATALAMLLGDCYAGFAALVLASDSRLERAACWAHVRRKFFELETQHPLEAARLLALIGMLYDVEDRAKPLTPEERRALRETEARPVLEKIRAQLFGETYERTLPKSALREALNYARNHWAALQTYVTDGRLPIDNNDVEQLMKQVALGRKNWLIVGSVAAGECAARLISAVSSALRNDLDVERHLTDVLRKFLDGCTDYRALLPHVWRAAHLEAVRTYHEDECRDASERQRHRREQRRQYKPLTADFPPAQQAEILRRAKEKLTAKRADRAAGR